MPSSRFQRLFGGERHRKPRLESGLAPGSVFRRVRSDRLIETATVRAVLRDRVGIPHVRFDVIVHTPSQMPYAEEQRLLSLASFTEYFRDRVAA